MVGSIQPHTGLHIQVSIQPHEALDSGQFSHTELLIRCNSFTSRHRAGRSGVARGRSEYAQAETSDDVKGDE